MELKQMQYAVSGGVAPPANPVPICNVEAWNGTAWAEVNNLNTSKRSILQEVQELQPACLIAMGGRLGAGSPPGARTAFATELMEWFNLD